MPGVGPIRHNEVEDWYPIVVVRGVVFKVVNSVKSNRSLLFVLRAIEQ